MQAVDGRDLPVCAALGVARAALYRHRSRSQAASAPVQVERSSPRALGAEERQAVLATLHCERFVDQAPTAVYAALLDEGTYLCSERTMYRLLEEGGGVRERRDQLRHPVHAKPELLASRPNEVWSWDITKLLGPAKWTYFYLYVLPDIYSRYVVEWMVAHRESATLAKKLIAESASKQTIARGQLTVRRPRLLDDLEARGVAARRPGGDEDSLQASVSNDNPFSEAQFKTMKYRPEFPDPIRQHPGRSRLLRRVLRLVQQPPLSLGARAAHAGDGDSRRYRDGARAARRDPRGGLRGASRALRAADATTG